MATRLETAMDTLISVFHSYAGQQGDKYKVNIAELNKMVDTELPGLRKKNKDPNFVKSMLEKIDIDKNGEVDFKEFMSLIAAITLACDRYFEDYLKQSESTKSQTKSQTKR